MKGIAKYLTLTILGLSFVIGCVGSFIPIFSMNDFTLFLESFSPIYMFLVASIGANSAISKINSKK